MDKSNDVSKENSFVKFLKTTGKFIGCVVLGTVLTAFHYAFDLILAPFGTIYRTITGCKNLYTKTKPKGFFQHLWFVFKSVFLLIYNLIKLPFLLIYRATFGLVEHAVGIIKPMCCVFRGQPIAEHINFKQVRYSNKFHKWSTYYSNDLREIGILKSKTCMDALKDSSVDPKKIILLEKYSNINLLLMFAVAGLEFESPLFNNPENHGKFKQFFTGIWDTVHTKFGNFAEWLLIPKIDSNNLATTKNINDYNNTKEDMQSNSSASKKEDDKFDIFDNILYPIEFSEKELR